MATADTAKQAAETLPVYYELSWAILSTVGTCNVCIGFMVMGIAGFTPICVVPLIVSLATAIANGLCYYAFYASYPKTNTLVASGMADISWLVQEAGLSFYSYVILNRVLVNRERKIFMGLFWGLIVSIVLIRMAILVARIRYLMSGATDGTMQEGIDHLHGGYFAGIAVVEVVSAVFLLRKFKRAKNFSMKVAMKAGLFSFLMRSTEIRLALLALIGVMRAVTYSFQDKVQSATTVLSQLDRYAYTLECMFPVVMYIDIIASRLVFAKDGVAIKNGASGGNGVPMRHLSQRRSPDDIENLLQMYSMSSRYKDRDRVGVGYASPFRSQRKSGLHDFNRDGRTPPAQKASGPSSEDDSSKDIFPPAPAMAGDTGIYKRVDIDIESVHMGEIR